MYTTITKNVAEASQFVKEGRIVAVPTGTAYALACDALAGHALQRLRILKQRPQEKPFTVFMSKQAVYLYINILIHEQELWEKYAGQPLTLLVEPKEPLKHLAQDGRVGLRMIDHSLMQALADATQVPLTATSANISGQPPAYDSETILKQWPGVQEDGPTSPSGLRGAGTTYNLSLAAILDGGKLPQNPPTTIARLDGEKITIIRAGALQPQFS